ncbi:MAG: molybdenum cofactor biosynthesis protein MoaE, partial [Bacteroidales bacterium]
MNMFIEGPIPAAHIEKAYGSSEREGGATMFFVGKVRPDRSNGAVVNRIEFTANRKMAEKIASEILGFSVSEFNILHAEIRHSIGSVPAGQPCFLVIVHSRHRAGG